MSSRLFLHLAQQTFGLGSGATLLMMLSSGAAWPQSVTDDPEALMTVVVTATRTVQSSFELPVAITRVDSGRIREGQLQINLSESLNNIAGVSAQNRQNYAQDLQVSIRGFGARSSFGTRGIRLIADGIPGTMPDGQGQFSHFDLGSAEHIEVLRGPFSVLYGNSSGGVIAVFTEAAPHVAELSGSTAFSSFGAQRYAFKAAAQTEQGDYVVSAAHFRTTGYRDHSQAQRNNVNATLRLELGKRATLTLVGNALQTPFVDDPLGLTAAQLNNPAQAGNNALLYNTRKSLAQEQIGARLEYRIAPDTQLSAMVYDGHRATTQYLAIPASAQTAATHPGGVIDLSRNYGGTDLRLTHNNELAGGPLELTLGVNYDLLGESRLGYQNFSGAQLGVKGALRRSERNTIDNLDEYVQAQWDPAARWRVLAGVRNSVVNAASRSRLTGLRSDLKYQATTPAAGITFRATPNLNLYASWGRGFETPTLNEIAYRSTDGTLPGLNLGLQPSRSTHYELGAKFQQASVTATLTGFAVNTHNELAVLANAGGRAVYQNVASTRRRGAELEIAAKLSESFSGELSYSGIRAVTDEDYISCNGLPCTASTILKGSRLPAVPRSAAYAALTWRNLQSGFSTTAEVTHRSAIHVNDSNTQSAAGYTLANLRAGITRSFGLWQISLFGRVDNLADRRYIGSAIVNESNGRFFEPAPGRNYALVIGATRRAQD